MTVSVISIHAPRVGRDSFIALSPRLAAFRFQSTRPVWGATSQWYVRKNWKLFQSTRPVWGATVHRDGAGQHRGISIHAPRVGRDNAGNITIRDASISIHAPRVGRDVATSVHYFIIHLFQSTRPVWGATFLISQLGYQCPISIHAPRVGRDLPKRYTAFRRSEISIHAPRVGRDQSMLS